MNPYRRTMLLLTALFAHAWSSANARDFYVDVNTGSDENPGTAQAPWRTVRKAFTTVTAGATVRIAPGVYPESYLRPQHSGTADRRIVYTRWEKGGPSLYRYPVIGGGTRKGNAITCTDLRCLTFEKLVITAPDPKRLALLGGDKIKGIKHREGLILHGACTNIVVRHCLFLDVATRGIFAGGGRRRPPPPRDAMDNCEFHDNKFVLVGMETAGGDINFNFGVRHHIHHNLFKGYVDGVVFTGPGCGSVIEHNSMLEHYREDGIDIKKTYRRSERAKREQWWTVIRNNYVGLHPKQSEITIQYNSKYVKCYGNVIFGRYGFGGLGIWLHGNQKSRGGAQFVELHDNVIWGTGNHGIYPKLHPDSRGKPEFQHYISNVAISNNTVVNCGQPGIMVRSGKHVAVSRNLVYNTGPEPRSARIETHSDVQNPVVKGNVLWPADQPPTGNVASDPGDAVNMMLTGPAHGDRPVRIGAADALKLGSVSDASIRRIFTVEAVTAVSPTRLRVRFNKPARPATVAHLGVYRVWPADRFDRLDPEAVRKALDEEKFRPRNFEKRDKTTRAAVTRERYLKIVLEREEVAALTQKETFKDLDGLAVTRAELADGNRDLLLYLDSPLQAGKRYELYVDHVSNENGAFVDINPIDERIHDVVLAGRD